MKTLNEFSFFITGREIIQEVSGSLSSKERLCFLKLVVIV